MNEEVDDTLSFWAWLGVVFAPTLAIIWGLLTNKTYSSRTWKLGIASHLYRVGVILFAWLMCSPIR